MRKGLPIHSLLLAALGFGAGMAQMPTAPAYANPYQSSGNGGRYRRQKARRNRKGAHDFSGMGWRK